RNAGLIVLVLVIVGAIVAAILLVGGGHHTNALVQGHTPKASSGASPTIASVQVYLDVTGHSFDNPGETNLTFDGNPATEWTTEHYGSPTFGNLYPGEGLIIQLKSATKLSQLKVTSTSQGWAASTYVSDTAQPNEQNVSEWGTATDSQSGIAGSAAFTLKGRTGRYVLLWITNLGNRPYQVNVGELAVSG
ncbi:MAG TPA: hypothetical protein VG435_03810, partial [Acidimicrobiales bacterium]|nr:hypothetical protein [Acidimicrobiales bacterium]